MSVVSLVRRLRPLNGHADVAYVPRGGSQVAMLEYSDDVLAFGDTEENEAPFFSQNYKALRHFARRLHCGGLTDYEASNGLVTAW